MRQRAGLPNEMAAHRSLLGVRNACEFGKKQEVDDVLSIMSVVSEVYTHQHVHASFVFTCFVA